MSMTLLWIGLGVVAGAIAVLGATALVRSGQQYDDELARDCAPPIGAESAGIVVREEPDRRQNIALRELVEAGEDMADKADVKEAFGWIKALNDLRRAQPVLVCDGSCGASHVHG